MKRGWKWALATIIMLAAMIVFAGAVTADEPEGQALPAVTVSGEADDGYWIYEDTTIRIDATDAKMLFLTVTNADTGEVILDKALHENTQAWRGDSYYGWGSRHQTVNDTAVFQEPGQYVITARGYWGAAATRTDLGAATWTDLGPATPTDLPPEDDPGWQETTVTITVQAEEGLPGAATISLNNLTNGEICRGELLSATVTPAEGLAYYTAAVYATDKDDNATGDSLFWYYCQTEKTYQIPTWEMAGDCVLQVYSVIPRHPARKNEVRFTVSGEASDTVAWALSKHTVDTDEPFSVGVYIPGAEYVYLDVYQGAYYTQTFSYGTTAVIDDIRLPYGPETEVFIIAYDQNWNEYTCGETLTINDTTDVPTPEFVQFPIMHTVGEDLTFTLQVDESKITKGPITYDARLYEYDYVVGTATSTDGTVTVTVPWSAFEDYQMTEPGANLVMFVRAHGQGYNAQNVQKSFMLGGGQDDHFRIAFSDTEGDHKQVYVNDGFTLAITLPEDTTGIDYIDIYNNYYWGSYDLSAIPEGEIETGYYTIKATDVPVMARYHTTADEWHYSNVLYVDYITHGPLPAPQAATNLTEEQDGTLSIEQWMPLEVTIENCDAYTGKGEPYLSAWIKRDTDGPEGEEILTSDYGRILTVDGGVWFDFRTVPDTIPEAGDYVLYLQANNAENGWETSETTKIHFTVTRNMKSGEILFTASDTEVMTRENFTLSAFAPGAERIEIWRRYSDEDGYIYSSADGFRFESSYSTTGAGEYTFIAKAYYADREPTVSDTVTVQITAPYGQLQTALRCRVPMFAAANEPVTVTLATVDPDETEPVIPDAMYVTLCDKNWNTVYSFKGEDTNTAVIPAAADGQPILENGKRYLVAVSAEKTGWDFVYFESWMYVGAETSESCTMTINGGTEQTLAAGEENELTFSGLPEGVTAVAVAYPIGRSWSSYLLEDPAATYTIPYFFHQEIPDGAKVYGRFTTDAFSYDTDPEDLHWIYTNSVTVTVTCEHRYIPFTSLKDYNDATIIARNGRYHQLTGSGREGERCEACGKERNVTEKTVTLTELHDDWDGDGYCDVCGYRVMGNDNWSIDGTTLTISMDGAIPDYESADETPWAYCSDQVERIILNSSVTGIGDYALAGFTNEGLRIEFMQESQPTISATAFAGTDGAVCRYYAEADWDGGSFGGTGITWIRLPFYREDLDEFSMIKYTEDGWVIHDYDTFTDLPVDNLRQAIEITWRRRNIDLEQTPTSADWTMITDYLNSTLSISFYPGCSGTLALTFDDGHPPIGLDVAAPELNLTVTDMSQNGNGISQFVMEGGQVTYNGSIQTLVLRSAFCESTGSSMTVNGDVREVDFYGSLNTRKYEGSLTVNGEIANGYEYGNVSMEIPNIENPVTFDDMILAGFSSIQQTEPVIRDGVLNISGVNPITGLTYDRFTLNYQLVSDGWYLELKEKAGSETGSLYGAPRVRLADYKMNFSADDIHWSKDTTIHIWNPGEQGSVVLNGPETGGTEIPLIMIEGGNVTVNCDVKELWLQRRYASDEPCTVTMNGRAAHCILKLYRKDGNLLQVGENGCIAEGGKWERMECDERFFGAAAAGTKVFKDGKLQVMSWRQGQRIQAELPSDNTVTGAAELSEGVKAMADLNESSEEELSDAEKAALTAFLAEQESGMTAAVFDATIFSYSQDEYGTITTYEQITNLDTPVEFKVSNVTGGAGYIVRLHEEGGEMKATQLTQPSSDTVIPFSSDLFSKYAIIASDWTPVAEWNDWELEPVGSYGEYVLHIYGNGAIPNYSSAMQAPWSKAVAGKENIRIVIDEGITGIGSNAFGALEGTVRADFLGSEMPDIDEDAFAGTTAVCRYYSGDASWTTGTSGRNDARWIRLPYYDEEDYIRTIYYNADGWNIEPRTAGGYDRMPVTPEQALEYTHEWRHIYFEVLPTETTDMTPVNNWKDVEKIYFGWDCAGSMEITLDQDSILNSIDFHAPNANVTIYDPRPEGVSGRVTVNYGTLNYQGYIGELLVEGSYENEGHVTVGGNVGRLNLYDSTSDRAFKGDLTVTGTIEAGTIYGHQTIDVPGIGTVDFGGMAKSTFENMQQDTPIVLNSELNLTEANQAKLVSSDNLTADQFNYSYQFLEGSVYFDMTLKDMDAPQYSAWIADIYQYNPNFTTDDVIYGDGTEIYIGLQRDTTLVFNGHTENGKKTGLRKVSMSPACNVVLNCPVGELTVYHFRWSEGAVNLQINDQVDSCTLELNKAPGTVVTLGEKGHIGYGTWNRTLAGRRYFSDVSGARELFSNSRLNILSRRAGETIQALLPSDTAVSAAAGQEATADLSQVTTNDLTPAESLKLDEYLATQGSDTVAAVFDVTVTEVIANGDTVTAGNAITELNEAIPLTVSNPAEGYSYVVRLHEDANGEMQAEQITAATDGSTIPFSSNLFSKYAVVEYKGSAVDPEKLTKKMILPASLKRIESGAFDGIGAEAVFIPAGCEYIGSGAFVNCGSLVYVEYYEGTKVEADAFEKKAGLQIKVRQR